jgi:hypothetical protein
MPTEDDPLLAGASADVREAFRSYRDQPDEVTWSRLSQLFIGQQQVVDAVKALDPTFQDPYPLAAADLVDLPDGLQWPTLPEVSVVLRAIAGAVRDGEGPMTGSG